MHFSDEVSEIARIVNQKGESEGENIYRKREIVWEEVWFSKGFEKYSAVIFEMICKHLSAIKRVTYSRETAQLCLELSPPQNKAQKRRAHYNGVALAFESALNTVLLSIAEHTRQRRASDRDIAHQVLEQFPPPSLHLVGSSREHRPRGTRLPQPGLRRGRNSPRHSR